MIAKRQLVNVTHPNMVLDFGSEYDLFKGRTVEVIILSDPDEKPSDLADNSDENTAFNHLFGAMRGHVISMAEDFDTCDNSSDWEAAQ